jgi:hypothetical protein
MPDFFPSRRGMPTDPRWVTVARSAGVEPVIVMATVWALLDYGSQHKDRSRVEGFDTEAFAAFAGITEQQATAIIWALGAAGIVVRCKFADGWLPVTAAERSRRYRNRKRAKRAAAMMERPPIAAAPALRPADELLDRLIAAANGNVVRDAPGILDLTPIRALIAAGCDLEDDILPVIKEFATYPERPPFRFWERDWLLDPIRKRRDDRLVRVACRDTARWSAQ